MATRSGFPKVWDHDGRRAERLDVRLKASLREPGSTKFDVEVLDMSVMGFRFDTSCNLTLGSRVWLTVPGLEALESRVVWRQNYRYGCAFENYLHTAVFDHLVATFRKQAREALQADRRKTTTPAE